MQAARMIECKEEEQEEEVEEEAEEAEEAEEEEVQEVENVTDVKDDKAVNAVVGSMGDDKNVAVLSPTPAPAMVVAPAEVQVKVEEGAVDSAVTTDTEAGMCRGGNVLSICPSVRKLVSNAARACTGPADVLTVTSRPETHVLAMITNDVEWVTKMNKEKLRLRT